jgi:hypothetical protein
VTEPCISLYSLEYTDIVSVPIAASHVTVALMPSQSVAVQQCVVVAFVNCCTDVT